MLPPGRPLANWYLNFLYNICVAAIDVTRDVVDGSILVFFRCFVFRVYYHRTEGVSRLMVHVLFVIRPCCFDDPATYGSPNIGRRGLLLVLCVFCTRWYRCKRLLWALGAL